MRDVTTGRLARALRPFFPTINGDRIRAAIDRGLIPASRNPLSATAWHFIPDDWIKIEMPKKLRLTGEQARVVWERLGFYNA